jgi:hypothetical protein
MNWIFNRKVGYTLIALFIFSIAAYALLHVKLPVFVMSAVFMTYLIVDVIHDAWPFFCKLARARRIKKLRVKRQGGGAA